MLFIDTVDVYIQTKKNRVFKMQITNILILKFNRIILKLDFSILVVLFLMSSSKRLEFTFIMFLLAIKFLTKIIEKFRST